jgi:hypothetical protein
MKIRNTPYLIQRAEIEDLDKMARRLKDEQYVTQVKEGKEVLRLSSFIDLDYMGSAEFEFGAIAKMFRLMEKEIECLNSYRAEQVVLTGHKGKKKNLHVVSCLDQEAVKEYVDKYLATDYLNKARLKERSGFKSDLINEANSKDSWGHNLYKNIDFWMDIENGVLFTYNGEFGRIGPSAVRLIIDGYNAQAKLRESK